MVCTIVTVIVDFMPCLLIILSLFCSFDYSP